MQVHSTLDISINDYVEVIVMVEFRTKQLAPVLTSDSDSHSDSEIGSREIGNLLTRFF